MGLRPYGGKRVRPERMTFQANENFRNEFIDASVRDAHIASIQDQEENLSVEDIIRRKLTEAFHPARLEIENESHLHKGHHGSPHTGESHYRVLLAAEAFEGINRVERQRKIYAVLSEELAGPVHALALTAVTPAEAARRNL